MDVTVFASLASAGDLPGALETEGELTDDKMREKQGEGQQKWGEAKDKAEDLKDKVDDHT